MTRNKDFKILVRARMGRTGETYTAARAHLARSRTAAAGRSYEAELRQRQLVDRWFVDGRLRSIPARRKVRAGVLLEVLRRFVPGRLYAEREISRQLERVHVDFAYLRRELVSLGYLQRRNGIYRVCSAAPNRNHHERRELPAWEEIWLPRFVAGVDVGTRSMEVDR